MTTRTHKSTLSKLLADNKFDLAKQQQINNRIGKKRFDKISKLRKFGNKFIQKLNLHRPANMPDDELRSTVRKINFFMNLPRAWNDTDYARSFSALKNLQRKTFNELPILECNINNFKQKVLNAMDKLQLSPVQKANLIAELYQEIGEELLLKCGDFLQPCKASLIFLLAQNTTENYPAWLSGELLKLVADFLTPNDMQTVGKSLYLQGRKNSLCNNTLQNLLQNTSDNEVTDDFGETENPHIKM
ncbi:MAG: hypothetical protein MJ032_01375 [Acidaminococcaceae bacterium]|nr:hypothetical protein [Acidaminococcaceae bacterium]